MSVAVVLNRGASTLKTADSGGLVELIRFELGSSGSDVEISLCEGAEIRDVLRDRIEDDRFERVIVGGGDGTVSLAAGLIIGTGKALGVLPLGTMNFFAQSLGMPLATDEAVQALRDVEVVKSDVGYANDRPFIHEFSLGLHPEMIEMREREEYGSRIGKIAGNLRAMASLIIRPPRVRVWFDDHQGNGSKPLATPAVIVSNNLYGEGHLPYADRLDGGVLGIYIVTSKRSADVAALAANMHSGAWQQLDHVDVRTAKSIRLNHRKPMKAAIDGELVELSGPVVIRSEAGALPVVVPRSAKAAAARGAAA